MSGRLQFLFALLVAATCSCDNSRPPETEAAKKERIYQHALNELRLSLSALETNVPVERGLTNLADSSRGEAMFREIFDANWIHSSFGQRWDEIPPPTIRGSGTTAEVEKFISENGWNMLTNDWMFLCLIQTSRGKPVQGLPWEAVRDRTFKAATHHGILYIPMRGSMPLGSSGVAYNPQTNRFHSVSAFKHIGDHWYVWRQDDGGIGQSVYEGEEGRPASSASGAVAAPIGSDAP